MQTVMIVKKYNKLIIHVFYACLKFTMCACLLKQFMV